jgi:glycosyltransferase involved in cell wall biosynthesis
MMKILHLITDLDTGGAETMLLRLLSRIDREAFEIEVGSLTSVGSIGKQIETLGIPVWSLGMRRGIPGPGALYRFYRRLQDHSPELIQTWMYHADLLGALGAPAHIPLVWGVHNTVLELGASKRLTRWTARMCARLSKSKPARIVCCSEASRRVHAALGYDNSKMLVIPNGFDLERFRPDPDARYALRQELGLERDSLLIGLAARFDPVKGHRDFIQAASFFRKSSDLDVHFALCGKDVDWSNRELADWIETAGLKQRFHLLGPREDMPRFFAALDLSVSSSTSEAFPLAVGEAMACGIPCAVTNVGDSALIVGDTGRVVPSSDAQAMANAWRGLLELPAEERMKRGLAARARIAERYELGHITARYLELYREIVANSA